MLIKTVHAIPGSCGLGPIDGSDPIPQVRPFYYWAGSQLGRSEKSGRYHM